MSQIIVIVAFLCACVSTVLAFGWFGTTSDDAFGWLAAAIAVYLASLIARDRAL